MRGRWERVGIHVAVLVSTVLVLLVAVSAFAQETPAAQKARAAAVTHTTVTDQMLLAAANDTKNWLTYGGDYSNTRFSKSERINAQSVSRLMPRWVFQTSGPVGSFETTPLVVDGVMYLTTPFNHAIAVDVKTGWQLWRYEHKLSGTEIFCCGPNNRGVAVYGDRVFMATLDAHLVALDRKTGKVTWDV